jgi:hypothetical protein
MEDLRNPYSFKANKTYEETFVGANKDLIKNLTGADEYYDISSSFLDKDAGIDGIAKLGKDSIGIALRIRKPEYYKWRFNFTLGHHYDKDNSQVHAVLNSLRGDVMSPNYILQINGVQEDGYCKECYAIKVQTDVFATYLTKKIDDNTLDNYYQTKLASYEFTMQDVYHELTTGVEFYLVQDNTITKNLNNDED